MKNIKNSYFRAIAKVTSNGKLPEYSDLWRCYHSYACMFDSDYSLFTESRFFNESDSALFSSGCDSSEAVFGMSREGRSGAAQNRTLGLYVPVTRKVSPTTGTKEQKLH